MQFKTILGLVALTSLGAAMPTEGDSLTPRAITAAESFCCTRFVVPDVAGTGCSQIGRERCKQRETLHCNKGAIVFPPGGRDAYVVCK